MYVSHPPTHPVFFSFLPPVSYIAHLPIHPPTSPGFFFGPLGTDWHFTHDVIFSSFHPLQSDHDFGCGPAFLYHLGRWVGGWIVYLFAPISLFFFSSFHPPTHPPPLYRPAAQPGFV